MINYCTDREVVMLPLSEVLAVKWTDARRRKLKELRGDVPLAELARRLSKIGVTVSRQYLDRMEKDADVKGASPELLLGICQVLGVDVAQLLCLNQTKIVQLWD